MKLVLPAAPDPVKNSLRNLTGIVPFSFLALLRFLLSIFSFSFFSLAFIFLLFSSCSSSCSYKEMLINSEHE